MRVMGVARFGRFIRAATSLDVDKQILKASAWHWPAASRSSTPDLKTPKTDHWERAFRLFDLLIQLRMRPSPGRRYLQRSSTHGPGASPRSWASVG
jgi:hypothetical protein